MPLLIIMYCICLVEYFGAHTIGWQSQPGMEYAIQDHIQDAIFKFTGNKLTNIDCAGRTDKGVHALGQVIGFHTELNRTQDKWITGLNHYLPTFIRIIDWVGLSENQSLHPRFSAVSRTYKYYIMHARRTHSCLQGLITPFFQPFDRDKLKECAKKIIGVHDFRAFQGGSCQAKTSIKTCLNAQWVFFENMSVFEIRANAFLHHMVRYLVGSQLQVALGVKSTQWFADLLENKDSQDACAPPQGLYLTHVEYPQQHMLPWIDTYMWFDPRFQTPRI